MFQLMIKLILVSFYALLTACSPNGHLTENLEPKGKAFFDPHNRTMLGHKLYEKMDTIANDSNYTFLKKEFDVIYYTVKNKMNDPRLLSFIVSVRNDKVYSIESRYEYPNFSSCNDAVQKIYDETKDSFPLEKRENVSDKGYTFDGISKNFIFVTACTDLLEPDKIIHSSIYTR